MIRLDDLNLMKTNTAWERFEEVVPESAKFSRKVNSAKSSLELGIKSYQQGREDALAGKFAAS